MMKIELLLDQLKQRKVENTLLFFITRVLKPNLKKTSSVLEKFNFKVYQADINDEIRYHLYQISEAQIAYHVSKNTEFQDYDVITDDLDHFFNYKFKNKTIPFADVINNQLMVQPPKIISLEEVINKEELWGYCVGFFKTDSESIFSFRKLHPGKIAIDEKESNKKSLYQKMIRTVFNSKSQKLELIKGETINLDKQNDCVYFKDTFFIFNKTQFEQMVMLDEEFQEQAKEFIIDLKKTNFIDGLDFLENQIGNHSSIQRKLVRLAKLGNHRNLNQNVIKKMMMVCRAHGDKLKVRGGKIYIEDDGDAELVLKMLGDYYKRGEVSGLAYGTFSGKIL